MLDGEKDELIARVLTAQYRLERLVASSHANPLLSLHLTMQQLKVLVILFREDACSSQDLTRALGVSSATVTGIVDRLAAQDLVARREDPHDRRVRLVEPTEAGRALVRTLQEQGSQHMRALLARLTDDELRDLERIVNRLHEVAQQDG
ncbi:MarR family winged helix-turn-helix transcriptional regulator [Umezawaea beigongshangensis]|uniref:MarR family winged helix-turn-helix transcriptional regulator n=1 Tax=Umezawaea beigongshangensis TaxID=2780383 RepID=UPI0018F12FFD|nr:MarR family transcriptional regulator [Umezawaea beigongshangensis]